MTDESLFAAALEKPTAAERKAFVEAVCAADPAQQQRLELLLAGHQRASGILDQSAVLPDRSARDGSPVEQAGSVLAGRYKLLEEIGEGGMGTVWVAEQLQPVRRKVAVKLVKAGMDTKTVLARFEAERQALALMDHPSIAKVLDGGTTDAGRPFFVMEYVKGVPITTYSDDARLSIADRLTLFVPVCQAVQHAHTKGIIHRDLKPSNILICLYDGRPVPKVIDFGLAKAMHLPLTEHTLHTAHGLMLGTPLYMSPEQAEFNNLDVDTRTDVYALGVVLYELLTGTTPLERERFRRAAWDEMLRLIREEEPLRPSTRLSGSGSLPSVAAQRQMEPVRLTRLVRGELDWIVMKCLEKDRSRRYDTANGLAQDVQRYLVDETVEACPPSAAYRLRKAVRKYRTALATAATIAILLIGGTAVSIWQAVRAGRAEVQADQDRQAAVAAEKETASQRDQAIAEKRRADEERAVSLAVSDFLRKDLLGQVDIENQVGGSGGDSRDANITVRTALDRAAKAVETKFSGQPLTEAAVRLTIAEAYTALGLYPEARRHAERSVELRTIHQGADHADTLTSRNVLAGVLFDLGLTAQSEEMYQDILVKRMDKLSPDHPDTLTSMHNLAFVYIDQGRYEQAEPLLQEVLRKRTTQLGATNPETLGTRLNLAWLFNMKGERDKSVAEFIDIAAVYRTIHGTDHPGFLGARNNLGLVYTIQGKHAEAETIFRELIEKWTTLKGPTHPNTLGCKMRLAQTYMARRQYDRGVPILAEVHQEMKARHGADHRDTWAMVDELSTAYVLAGQPEKAVPLLEKLLAKRRDESGRESLPALLVMQPLAKACLTAGQIDAALPLYAEYVAAQRTRMGADSIHFANLLSQVGMDLMSRRLGRAAEKYLRECLAIRRAKQPAAWVTFATESLLGGTLLGQKRYDEAEPLLLSGYAGLKAFNPLPAPAQPFLPSSADRLLRLYEEWGKPAEAAKWRAVRAKYPIPREVLPPPNMK
jgi:tetratricopeptide (TPR) repeat protein